MSTTISAAVTNRLFQVPPYKGQKEVQEIIRLSNETGIPFYELMHGKELTPEEIAEWEATAELHQQVKGKRRY